MKRLAIEEDRLGKMVCTETSLQAGDVVCRFTGKPIDYKTTLELGNKESFALQVAPDVYIYLDEPFRYFNHSCEPNCGLNKDLDLIALREISAHEELTYDYSTTMLEHHWTMKCECRKESCRGVVGDFDKLPIATQEKYIKLEIVQPFILQMLDDKKSG